MSVDNDKVNLIYEMGEKAIADYERNREDPRKAQLEFLQRIISENKDTEYGKKYNFDQVASMEDYRANVPVTEYSDY